MVQEEREEAWLLGGGEATAAGGAWVGEATSVEVGWTHSRATLAAEVCQVEADTSTGGHGREEVDMLVKVGQLRAANAALKRALAPGGVHGEVSSSDVNVTATSVEVRPIGSKADVSPAAVVRLVESDATAGGKVEADAGAAPQTCLANAATPGGTLANFQNGIFEMAATGRRAVGPDSYYVGKEQAAEGGKWWPEGHFSPRGSTSTTTTAAKTTPRARSACPGPGGMVVGGVVDKEVDGGNGPDLYAGAPIPRGRSATTTGSVPIMEAEGPVMKVVAEGPVVEDLVMDDVWLWLAGGPGGPEDVVEEEGEDQEDRAEGEGEGHDDGGREPCRKLSIQVQGGSRLKESSGCLALKNSESESALARPGQGKVDGNGASVAQLVEAIETKSWRRDGAAAVEVVQEEREEAWLLASQVSEQADGEATAAGRAWVGQQDTSVEVAGAHPRTTRAAEVCEEETDTLAGGHGGEEVDLHSDTTCITSMVDLLQQCEELGLVEEVSIVERVLAEVIACDIAGDDGLRDENVELVKRIVALEKLQADQGAG